MWNLVRKERRCIIIALAACFYPCLYPSYWQLKQGPLLCNSAVDIMLLWAIDFSCICIISWQRESARYTSTNQEAGDLFITSARASADSLHCRSRLLSPAKILTLITVDLRPKRVDRVLCRISLRIQRRDSISTSDRIECIAVHAIFQRVWWLLAALKLVIAVAAAYRLSGV